eukprot:GCRY01003110.1.p1 GENE.GCRY01003110.1~~GCRY01003110.1.p1  ORF type:complete len:314 (+),score=16.49 GCRY01003110.1:180-1121(+)
MRKILDSDLLALSLSNLACVSHGSIAYTNVNLRGEELENVALLKSCDYLENIDLSNNALTDLVDEEDNVHQVLKHLIHVNTLNLSGNKLQHCLPWDPTVPEGSSLVATANYSNNLIENVVGLKNHAFLRELNLDDNHLTSLEGFVGASSLRTLSVKNNNIHSLKGLENLQLRKLNLEGNCISSLEFIDTLTKLTHLNLNNQRPFEGGSIEGLTSFEGVQNLHQLTVLSAAGNCIGHMDCIMTLSKLVFLRELNLINNPVCSTPDYFLHSLFLVQQLTHFDLKPVSAEDKVKALCLWEGQPTVEEYVQKHHKKI